MQWQPRQTVKGTVHLLLIKGDTRDKMPDAGARYLFDRELTRTLSDVQRGVTRGPVRRGPGVGPGHPPLVILKSLSGDYLYLCLATIVTTYLWTMNLQKHDKINTKS